MLTNIAVKAEIQPRSTGFSKNLTVAGPRSTARLTETNRELMTFSRPKVGRPKWGPVDRPVDRETCTHARTQTVRFPVDRSADRSDLKQSWSTGRSTASGQKLSFEKDFEEILIDYKIVLIMTRYNTQNGVYK